MPRKRSGPPQENIDSILLALARRESIDPDTLDHYFARIREEWAHGAREKILHLLSSQDNAAQSIAIHLLMEMATEDDLDEVEEFVADPMISDMAKLPLAPLLQKLGSEMADEGMMDYLNDPITAMQQMQLRILDGVENSEMSVEAILKDVVALPLEKRLSFVEWLGNSHDIRATYLLIPFLESQTGKVATAVLEAFEQLGAIAAPRTIPALNYLLATSSNRQLKQTARATLGRLTMQSMPGTETSAIDSRYTLKPHQAHVSAIDGTGSQMIMLSWHLPSGSFKVLNIFIQDRIGIRDCFGLDEMSFERWQSFVDNMNENSFSNFAVPFSYIASLLAEARAMNKRGRHKLPVAFFVWRPLLENIAVDEQPVAAALPAQPFDDEMRALAQRGAELYGLKEFVSWFYDPISTLEPYMGRFADLIEPFVKPAKRGSRGSRKPKTKNPEQQIDAFIDEVIVTHVDDVWRLLYESRLRHQAQLLQLAGSEQEARLTAAVASMLHPNSQVPPQNQPFLQAMISISLEQGPMVMLEQMAEALDMKLEDLGKLPPGFFDDELDNE
jgi:hypothetical protein